MLRQFFLFEIIIVKYRKVVNAAERRTRDHDKWGMLPVYPYLFRAGGAAARLHAGVLCRFHPTGGAGTAAPGAGRQGAQQHYLCENGVGPEQWLEVLEDVHQPYQLLDTSKNAMNMAEEPVFCGICRF